MFYLVITCLTFLLAVLINSISAWMQRRYKFYSHLGPMAWTTHQFVIAPAWILFIVLVSQLGNFVNWPLGLPLQWLGYTLLAVAFVLFIAAINVLGIQSLTNGNLFGHGPQHKLQHGIFRYIQHPIYDSFTLMFIAVALTTNNAAYFVIAALNHLLLTHVQQFFEKIT